MTHVIVKSKFDTVLITFDLDTMEGFRSCKTVLSPGATFNNESQELEHGAHTHYSAYHAAVAYHADEIKVAWICQEHGTCFITADSKHVEINQFRLNAWASMVQSGQCKTTEPPPASLLQTWSGVGGPVRKHHGRAGLRGHASEGTTNTLPALTHDAAKLIVVTMGMVAQNMKNSIEHASSKRRHSPTPEPSPVKPSSPPPALSDELDVFLKAFCTAKNINPDILTAAAVELRRSRYMPDVIGEDLVTISQLRELTGLAEGEVHGLKKFAQEWSGKIAAKRAKRSM